MRGWLGLLRTDLYLMVRSPDNLLGMVLFAIVVLVLIHFALPPAAGRSAAVGSAAAWLAVTFSGILGLPPLQQGEDRVAFLPQLITGSLTSVGYYWEKLTVGFLQLTLTTAVVLPAAAVLFGIPFTVDLLRGGAYLLIGVGGTAVVITLASALTIGREPWLLPVLVFPLLIPVVLSTTRVLASVLSAQEAFAESWFHVMVAYDLLMVLGGWFLAEFLWEELPGVR